MILVVDDDRIIVEVLRQSLSLTGYRVEAAYDGEEGLEAARVLNPDIILLDVMMPKIDGYTVCKELKKDPDTQRIPIIILTALADRDDKLRALESGADEFIRKPPDRQELLIRIRTLLRSRRLQTQVEMGLLEVNELRQQRDQLIEMLVHDMRGPMSSVIGGLELMQRKQDSLSRDELDGLTTSAIFSSQRVVNMLETLLDFVRLEKGELAINLQPWSIDQLLQDTVMSIKPLLELDQIEIQLSIDQNGTLALVDGDLLVRVISNLLFNAIRFSPPKSKIRLWTQAKDKWMVISVLDHGPGIPPEHRLTVFEKYTQLGVGSRQSGVGLGLAFCRMAIEAMRGKIWVAEPPRKGTLFRVALQLAQPLS
ncbi:MAG: response regulator [Chloroflexota bacterium]